MSALKIMIAVLAVALTIIICFYVTGASSKQVFYEISDKLNQGTIDKTVSSSANTINTPTPSEMDFSDNDQLSFSDLNGIEFWFGSGVGAWCTTVTIQSDGTFVGYYQDSEMGSTGYMYPNGTRYECNFQGKFSSLTKTGAYQYSLKCESIEMQGTVGEEKFEDDIKKVTSEPYGFDNADEFVLFLPGKQTSELPNGFLSWSNGLANDEVLTCYGLYNVGGEEGFIVWPEQETIEETNELASTPIATLSISEITVLQKKYIDNDGLSFSDLDGIEFMSARGGVFAVNVMIQPDGTFNGSYSERSMTSVGDDYPNGTKYECNYSGQFSSLTKTGPYEYTMKCKSLEIQGTLGEEKIEDGTRIVTTDPHGFDNADEIILYLPGKRTIELHEGFLKWFDCYTVDGVIDNYILYNVGGEEGFVIPAG